MSHTNNHDTPRTNEVEIKCRKADGNDYWPGQMSHHARQLERENNKLRGDLEAALNSFHAANNELLTMKGLIHKVEHPNDPSSATRP